MGLENNINNLPNVQKQIEGEITALTTMDDCAAFHAKYLGKDGMITAMMKDLRNIPNEDKGRVGAEINVVKQIAQGGLNARQNEISDALATAKLLSDPLVDITIPQIGGAKGQLHPISEVMRDVNKVFASMGFHIETGPEVVTEYENFTSLNIPENHPARDIQDTFYLQRDVGSSTEELGGKNGQPHGQKASAGDMPARKPTSAGEKKCEEIKDGARIGVEGTSLVLKTHTSAMQNTLLRKYGNEFRAIFPGRCFRNEATDATHDMAFFQVEGIMVGREISIANLVYFMKQALAAVFKKDIDVRLRPGFFPFTEPSFELDASCTFCGTASQGNTISTGAKYGVDGSVNGVDGSVKGAKDVCRVCKNTGWIEFCGCGMIHPSVLSEGGVDPEEFQGFAFGFGLTRLAMLRYDIEDIRTLHN